jgi:hypothetical protein
LKTVVSLLAVFGLAAAAMSSSNAQAALYSVDRSFTDGSSVATLTGTLAVPTGSYTIQDGSASPFTAVDLTLTVGGSSYALTYALTELVFGSGQFFIDATPTTLTFSTATADGFNPADLVFSDTTPDTQSGNRYAIGYNGHPGFEVANTDTGVVIADVTFPAVFGTAVPEPGCVTLVGAGAVGLLALARRKQARWRAREESNLRPGD